MKFRQKAVLFVFLALCAALVLGACSPDADPEVATSAIQINNVPASIDDQGIGATGSKPLFKIYVQLSEGMNAADGYVAKGELTVDQTGTAYTIAELKDNAGNPWTGTNWANICVVISPKTVDDIFDIDARVAPAGPTTGSTVVLDWNSLFNKKQMDRAPGGDGIGNYKKLYGGDGVNEIGIIAGDAAIEGAKAAPASDLAWDKFK